jgi:hypothetical protein
MKSILGAAIASSSMEFEDEVEQSEERPYIKLDGRSKQTLELTSSIVAQRQPRCSVCDMTRVRLEKLEAEWGKRYPAIGQPWRRA